MCGTHKSQISTALYISYKLCIGSLYPHHQYRRSRTIYCATALNGVEGATNNLHFYVGILTTFNLEVVADVFAFYILFSKVAFAYAKFI